MLGKVKAAGEEEDPAGDGLILWRKLQPHTEGGGREVK